MGGLVSFGWTVIVIVGPIDSTKRTLEGDSGAKAPGVSMVCI